MGGRAPLPPPLATALRQLPSSKDYSNKTGNDRFLKATGLSLSKKTHHMSGYDK